MIRLISYKRNPNIGIVARVNDSIALVPSESSREFSSTIEETLKVNVYKTNISGTILVGTMLAMNNNGIVLPRHVYENELEVIREAGMNYAILEDKLNALGNLILVNDYGAVVAKEFSKQSIKKMTDVFACEVEKSRIGKFRNIGSLGIATNQGALFHPSLSEDELRWVEEILKVRVDVGTVNRGVAYVRTGVLANTKGIVVGSLTTGVEIVRIEDTLIRGGNEI